MGPRQQPQQRPVVFTLIVCVVTTLTAAAVDKSATPNVVLIMADDLGYGDLGCFGNTTIRTPHLDQLAAQGVKLTHNVAAATVCTPSRAAFMTGRYPIRSGMIAPHYMRAFIFTASASGLPARELTLGKVAKRAGYRTAFLGKWHQGWSVDRSDPDHPHPLNQGFDYFYGIPLTNIPDFGEGYKPLMSHVLPNLPLQLALAFLFVVVSIAWLVRWRYVTVPWAVLVIVLTGALCGTALFSYYHQKLLNSFMFRNYDLVEQPIDLSTVTRKLVAESEHFLQARHADHAPFLLLLSWLHVHTALDSGPEFKGRSRHGPYGDAVEEMDWGVGQVMDMLERLGMADNTLIYFTSDHGGLPQAKDLKGRVTGGFNGPFSGGKGDGSTEGSFRVPGIVRWPGHFPAGSVVQEPVSLMDVLPTLAELLHVSLDSDVTAGHVMDGVSLVLLLRGEEKVSPHQFLFHYCQDSVHAVTYRPRSGDFHEAFTNVYFLTELGCQVAGHTAGSSIWKLMYREPNPSTTQFVHLCDQAVHLDPPRLYELTSDPTAHTPLRVEDHAQVVSTMVQGLRQHQDSVQEVPSQFTWWRMLWQPWKQPCCHFPACACQDEAFKGVFVD